MVSIVFVLLFLGAVIGFSMHFLLPHRFAKFTIDIIAGTTGSAIGAVISSPFSPPGEFASKVGFLIGALVGAILAVLIARALKL